MSTVGKAFRDKGRMDAAHAKYLQRPAIERERDELLQELRHEFSQLRLFGRYLANGTSEATIWIAVSAMRIDALYDELDALKVS